MEGPGGHVPPPHFLADQLTLSQPGGGHIIPTQYYVPPQIFRPCDGPEIKIWNVETRMKNETKKLSIKF